MYKKIEKLRYAISDVMLKCGKELVKTIFYGVWESPLIKSLLNQWHVRSQNSNADRVRLTCSKHTRSLLSEEEFL